LLRLGAPLVEVWQIDSDPPPLQIPVTQSVLWMDFFGVNELVVQASGTDRQRLQFWDVESGAKNREFELPIDLFPPTPKAVQGNYVVNRMQGAISPGEKYLALGGPTAIALVNLSDGHVAGRLPLGGPEESAAYQGLRFSEDGALLIGLVTLERKPQRGVPYLKRWQLSDGHLMEDVALPRQNWMGLTLVGPAQGTTWLTWFQSQGDKIVFPSQSFEGGKAGREMPFTPLFLLADGRLLVVGPLGNGPPETPLPALLENPQRNDPAVRAVYPITLQP
jgi:hypothetical protein